MKLSIVLTVLMLLIVGAGSKLWAHGHEQHMSAEEMQMHMQQMMALKQQVPEEYRIMDRTPIAPDAPSLKHADQLYQQFCAACHGSDGDGDGPAAASMEPAPANFHDLDHSKIYGPGEKYWIIGNGSGKTGMPGFADELKPKDRWDLVNYIYQMQKQHD